MKTINILFFFEVISGCFSNWRELESSESSLLYGSVTTHIYNQQGKNKDVRELDVSKSLYFILLN